MISFFGRELLSLLVGWKGTSRISRSFGKGEHKIQGIGARVAEPGSTQDAKLPVSISVPENSDFKIWMESTMPIVAGLQFSFPPNELSPRVEWQLKQIDYRSVVDSALVAAGLKLD